jgi:hypothetical protein
MIIIQQKIKVHLKQEDGNFAFYKVADGQLLWSTGTQGSDAVKAVMEQNGDFLLLDAAGNEK